MLKGFKQFILRGNVIDLAVGVVIGAAFSNIVNNLVKDIITPIIGAIVKTPDFSNLVFQINGSKFYYGDFVNTVISFLLVSASVYFFIVLPINALIARSHKEKKSDDPSTKKCTECLSEIPALARKCSHCASPQTVETAASN